MRWLAVALIVLMGACRLQAVEQMSRVTQLVDAQYSAAYETVAEECLESSTTRVEYDLCMGDWDAGADAVRALINATRSLDATSGRRAYREAGCGWYRALAVVDAVSPTDLPAAKVGLNSKWRKKC